jgi:hypothetical protein
LDLIDTEKERRNAEIQENRVKSQLKKMMTQKVHEIIVDEIKTK